MKTKKKLLLAIVILFALHTKAQDFNQNDYKWLKSWANFEPNNTSYPDAEEILPKQINSDTFLSNDTTYLLSGDVYVSDGATLTIQQGTIIRCDHENPAKLIITRGSKLIAAGTESYPIVFTSNKSPKSRASGDWSGIIIAGSGKVNTVSGNGSIKGNLLPQYSSYGGSSPNEQTTILKYVRIEFPGNKTTSAENSNGLSLYGIGTASIISNVMVSYAAQDSFNWTAGSNNMGHLISFKATDDDFQMTNGFKGNLDNLIAIRHPFITSPRGSYAIEIDGYENKVGYPKKDVITDLVISNATLVNLSDKSNYVHTTAAISATNSALLYIHNSKISGFSDVVKFDSSYTSKAVIEKAFMMDNSFFNIHGEGVKVDFKPSTGVIDILKYNRFTQGFVNVDELFADPLNKTTPKFVLKKSLNTYMVMQ